MLIHHLLLSLIHILARFRPGLTGIVIEGILFPKISVVSLSIPILSYILFGSHCSRCIIRSIFSVSFTEPIPKILLAFIIPMPRSSIKCRILSGADPTRVFEETFLISTASSATRRWPRLMSSIAVSLLPTPVSYTHLKIAQTAAHIL